MNELPTIADFIMSCAGSTPEHPISDELLQKRVRLIRNFYKTKFKKGSFIPCDDDDNIMFEPPEKDDDFYEEDYIDAVIGVRYDSALKKVIFSGFRVTSQPDMMPITVEGNGITILFHENMTTIGQYMVETIEDIVKVTKETLYLTTIGMNFFMVNE